MRYGDPPEQALAISEVSEDNESLESAIWERANA
jgi:hypothetical protein